MISGPPGSGKDLVARLIHERSNRNGGPFVVVNAAIAELPKEKEGRYWSFVSGTVSYSALLLILSRVETAS